MNITKKPWLSALLNLLVPGAGYLYNGKRILFGFLLLISSLVGFIIGDNEYVKMVSGARAETVIIVIIVALTMGLAFVIDAYQEAVEINKRK